MIFNQTFNDPDKKIYYPSTWGGKTAPERFQDMKQELWYIVLAIVIKIVIGTVWLWLLYVYAQLIQYLARLNSLDDSNQQKLQNTMYLSKQWRFRWIMIGLILIIITGLWVTFSFTREALLYGASVWIVSYLFRRPLMRWFQKLKQRMYQPLSDREQ